jgi:hypothetical protein
MVAGEFDDFRAFSSDRRRFENDIPPVMEARGLAGAGHNPTNNRKRAR